jgi:hypothetical protein
MPKVEITDFYVAGVQFYEGQHRVEDIHLDTEITFQPDPMNEYDNNAVKLMCFPEPTELLEYTMLGYVPKTHSQLIAGLLKKSVPLDASFSIIDPGAKTHKMFRVAVSLI